MEPPNDFYFSLMALEPVTIEDLQLGKQEGWVKSELDAQLQTELKDVLLATIDGKDQLQVFYYR
ncbi:hypothetical protein LF817_15545 [Halobacillus sp. A1]|uniref:hypothetical protein n=1 Tax=Halobacillus sp. A1 TaxID=2880262 RepID=UPI0020A66DBB|nr:hypothetical protein [Halobacillus sp. A1]MCP3032738.1 hypothetical protein [Halobacillus sp. A1]